MSDVRWHQGPFTQLPPLIYLTSTEFTLASEGYKVQKAYLVNLITLLLLRTDFTIRSSFRYLHWVLDGIKKRDYGQPNNLEPIRTCWLLSLGDMLKLASLVLECVFQWQLTPFLFSHLPKQNLHAPQLPILLSPPTPAVPIQPCLLGLTTRATAWEWTHLCDGFFHLAWLRGSSTLQHASELSSFFKDFFWMDHFFKVLMEFVRVLLLL